MSQEALLYWHTYQYFPYEKELAQREVETMLAPATISQEKDGLRITGDFKASTLSKLVYFGHYQIDATTSPTLQRCLEGSIGGIGEQRKQSTRYSVHGLHEYKGKFNPQIVRGMLNILGVLPGMSVIDPFCGSGTTLIECTYGGIRAVGHDLNPLAVLISNAKLQALQTPAQKLRKQFQRLYEGFDGTSSVPVLHEAADRIQYLQKWFDPITLAELERLRALIRTVTEENEAIFQVLASDLLRDYSQQEPSDLRIRRRRSPLPTRSFKQAFWEKVEYFLANLEAAQEITGTPCSQSIAYEGDSRQGVGDAPPIAGELFDAALTSPPYATALPYIDTQRLSLVWLALVTPSQIKELEAELTGSREFVAHQSVRWREKLLANEAGLPASIYEYCLDLLRALTPRDGFRRQAVPSLMYRYLSDMQAMFRYMSTMIKPGSPFALVVGHNHTILGGTRFDINTPELLKGLALQCGWTHQESFPLQTYHRYSLHSHNAIKTETLLILRKS